MADITEARRLAEGEHVSDITERLRQLGAGHTEWRVQDKDGAYCIAFSRGDGYSLDPEREAREWLARQKREFPGCRYATGYEVADVRVQTTVDKALCEAADAIDSLRAEVAVLQMACSRWERALEHGADRIRNTESERDSLRAQVEALRDTAGSVYRALGVFEPDAQKWPALIEALRADAERYRWLRLRKVVTAPHEAIARHAAERFDAAIDAARSQEAAG